MVHGLAHQARDFRMIMRVAQHPAELHQRRLREHIVQRHHADVQQIASGVVHVHLGESPQRLHGHDDVHALVDGALEGRKNRPVHVAEPRAGNHDPLIPLLDQRVDQVGLHPRIVIQDRDAIVVSDVDLHLPAGSRGT